MRAWLRLPDVGMGMPIGRALTELNRHERCDLLCHLLRAVGVIERGEIRE